MVSLDDLQAALLGIPGVVGAEVSATSSGLPSVRVWTDDTRDPDELTAEVRSLVVRAATTPEVSEPAAAEPFVPETIETEPPAAKARSGLGRGLDSLIAVADAEPPPAHLVAVDLTRPAALDMIAVEESASGVTVRAVDSTGASAEAKAIGGASALNPAIVAAVSELLEEAPSPRLVSAELRDTEIATVLVVTLELADTEPAAGAAVVRGGMPFTLGRAVWTAISSTRA